MARVEQYHMDLYFESAGMILTLITPGQVPGDRSKGKTSQAISRLDGPGPQDGLPSWRTGPRQRSRWRRSGWATG